LTKNTVFQINTARQQKPLLLLNHATEINLPIAKQVTELWRNSEHTAQNAWLKTRFSRDQLRDLTVGNLYDCRYAFALILRCQSKDVSFREPSNCRSPALPAKRNSTQTTYSCFI